MKVVILCGGKGTRLREETEYRPKPMVPIGGRPILWHIMKLYAHYGHTEFILCLGYKGEVIKDYFRSYKWNVGDVTLSLGPKPEARFEEDYPEEEWTVTLADTGLEAQTGARIAKIRKYLDPDEDFLLTYGDGVGDVDIPATIETHRRCGGALTITSVHPPGRFGELRIAENGRIRAFNEKPQTTEGYISGGFFVASPSIFDYIDRGDHIHFEREPIESMVQDGVVFSHRHEGFWQPMDTYAEFLLLNRLWQDDEAPWRVW